MTFEEAVTYILVFEGGYSNNPKDPGGETNFGISKRAHPEIDIKNLTKEKAKDIYREDYWLSSKANELQPFMRLLYFDSVVNHGQTAAVKILQKSLGFKDRQVDGIFGEKTMEASKKISTKDFIYHFAMERHRSYAENPRWQTFGKGWSKRLLEVTLITSNWLYS